MGTTKTETKNLHKTQPFSLSHSDQRFEFCKCVCFLLNWLGEMV